MRAMMSLVTEFGDAAFLLPASLGVAILLLRARSRRTALAWISAVALCVGATILAKLAFYACAAELPFLDIRSPSGHTSLSTTFYACVAMTISADKPWSARLGLFFGCGTLVAAIAASRILNHAHTPEEVVAGLLVGLCCVSWYRISATPWSMPGLGWQLPVLAMVALLLLLHGRHFTLEARIAQLADRLWFAQYACRVPPDEAAGLAAGRGTFPAS